MKKLFLTLSLITGFVFTPRTEAIMEAVMPLSIAAAYVGSYFAHYYLTPSKNLLTNNPVVSEWIVSPLAFAINCTLIGLVQQRVIGGSIHIADSIDTEALSKKQMSDQVAYWQRRRISTRVSTYITKAGNIANKIAHIRALRTQGFSQGVLPSLGHLVANSIANKLVNYMAGAIYRNLKPGTTEETTP